MKKNVGRLVVVLVLASLFAVVPVRPSAAEEMKGKWGYGIRAGLSSLTQDVNSITVGKLGPIVSGNVLYSLSDQAFVGLNVEWEQHSVEFQSGDLNLGKESTLSILPFIEVRMPVPSWVQPYLSLGLGVNINSFSESGDIGPFNFNPENTFALKMGLGADFPVSPALAINGEIGWKYNSGNSDFSAEGGIDLGFLDNNMSAVSFLIGFRFYPGR
jgi:Outer membrane protein beta-barrel domain